MSPSPRRIGVEFPYVPEPEVPAVLQQARAEGFNFISLPLRHPEQLGSVRKIGGSVHPVLPDANWGTSRGVSNWSSVIPKISWLDLDTEDKTTRKNSEAVLLQELQFIHLLGCESTIVEVRCGKTANLMRNLCSYFCTRRGTDFFKGQLWLQIPTSFINLENGQDEDTWNWWDNARLMCESKFLGHFRVVLELTFKLPDASKLDRWLGEPVEMVIVPFHIFVCDRGTGDYPVLLQYHQEFLKKLALMNTPILFTGGDPYRRYQHLRYLCDLYYSASIPEHMRHYLTFADELMTPLQPLANHLSTATYEIFESDPVKYKVYGEAVYQALLDRVPESDATTNTQVIMVVGAGRGPLVTESIKAAERAHRKIRVYAVDKNPTAIVMLQRNREKVWGDVVKVVSCDMRKWKAPEKCDILVSELLGSFGDNELSPECLDGAQVYLKDDGISIPASYRSFVCPIMSMDLYTKASKTVVKHAFEDMYVVGPRNVYTIAPHQQLLEFCHPNRSPNMDNDQFKTLKWTASQDCTLHGFFGYFDTTLYKDIELSIRPDSSYTKGMMSWAPYFFPVNMPISVKRDEAIELLFWRLHDESRVWYEWAVSSPTNTTIHNLNGRCTHMGLEPINKRR